MFKPTFWGVGTGTHVIALGTGLVLVATLPAGPLLGILTQFNDIYEILIRGHSFPSISVWHQDFKDFVKSRLLELLGDGASYSMMRFEVMRF